MQGHRAAVPSAFIFVRVFVAYALAAHCFVCFWFDLFLSGKSKKAKSCATAARNKNTRQK